MLALAGLDECADRRARTLSGGQARRLDFALALVGDPELIFLDEPTTGFDPGARRAAWDVIRALRDLGKTVVLTTHYLDEAQTLADRVAILQDGRILAEGPPDALGAAALPGRLARRRRHARGALHRGPDGAAGRADRRGARARRAAGGAERHAAEPRGRLPRADGGVRLRRAAAPCPGGARRGASTGSSAGCSGATRARRSSASCSRSACSRSSAPCSPAARRTST